MNGPYPEITNISFLAKLFFKTFISLKHLSDYRTVGLSDRRTIGLSDYRYGPVPVSFTVDVAFPGCCFLVMYFSLKVCYYNFMI